MHIRQEAAADEPPSDRHARRRTRLVVAALVAVAAIAAATWFLARERPDEGQHADEIAATDEHEESTVTIPPDQGANLEYALVEERAASGPLRVPGAVEVNSEQTQQATPLVGGRIERVYVAQGARVRAGAPLAEISSPMIAQMHGKLHEADTRVALAERNVERVTRAESRVGVLSAQARLDEAAATLERTRKLAAIGAVSGSDLMAAETAHKTTRAEYEFQSNIALNREVHEARAELETARVDAAHILDEMRSLGVEVSRGEHDHERDSSRVLVRAPVSGIVVERLVNAGAGVEAGRPLFTISNTSTVWVIASVPESRIASIRTGTTARIRSAALGEREIAGRVGFVDPRLDETTRTARVRIEVPNPGEVLKAGMFADVRFEMSAGASASTDVMVPSAAVQRIGERAVVFVPSESLDLSFEVRDVDLGGEVDGFRRVLAGLAAGERIVTRGSFALKARLLAHELEDSDHH